MDRFIMLLRGINVGGKNTLSMPELKRHLEANGFLDVVTYINSGNIIFSSPEKDRKALKRLCEALIRERFGLEPSVMVISADELREALNHAPEWWDTDPESKHNAIFVIPPATVADVYETVGAAKPEYEKVAHHGQVIFWSAPIKTFSRTRWLGIVGSACYASVTIRNCNTARKLVKLSQQ